MDKEQIKELITRRRKQILVHGFIYYRLNTTIVSDHTYDSWAKELMKLQKAHPEMAAECIEHEAFAKFDETVSGFDLPLYGWVQSVALRLLKYHETHGGR